MKKEEIFKIIKISIAVAIVIGLGYLFLVGLDKGVKSLLKGISYGSSIVVILWGLYFKWGWKSKSFKWIIERPNVDGSWAGELISDWKDQHGQSIAPKTFFIAIHQNFLATDLTTFTDNFIGTSYAQAFLFDNEKGISKLIYLFKKDTADIGIQESNEGAAELRIIKAGNEMKLEGNYWTNIKTNGIIKVTKISNEHIQSFEEGLSIIKLNGRKKK